MEQSNKLTIIFYWWLITNYFIFVYEMSKSMKSVNAVVIIIY